ncbi:MAG: ABC transporter permease, partial [Planctomycetota bacterium]
MSLFWLAWSYFRHRFLLTLSALGIGLGVAVVFAVLAVLNGFLQEFENTLREFSGDVVVRPRPSVDLEEELAVITSVPGVLSASPRLNWFALIGRRGTRAVSDPRASDLSGLLLVGIDPGTEGRHLAGSLSEAELSRLLGESSGGGNAKPPILLGAQAAKKLGLERGDSLETITFLSQRRGRAYAARKTFRVAGTFKTGQYSQDLDRALVRRSDLEAFTRHPEGATQLVVRTGPGQQPRIVAGRSRAARAAARMARGAAL